MTGLIIAKCLYFCRLSLNFCDFIFALVKVFKTSKSVFRPCFHINPVVQYVYKHKGGFDYHEEKRFSRLLFLMLTIMITVTFYQPAQAASGKYTGTYTKTWSVSSNMTVTIKPSYSVIVNKVTSTKVRLQLEKLGVNGSPIYATAPITAKRKGNTVSFKWKDTWGNSGTGTLKLYKGYVKLKVKQTYTARWNRSTLDTSGKYMKIYRQSGNTKMDNIDL